VTASCQNCGETVSQSFCPSCGQAVEERRGPLVALVGDFVSEFFSLDGRLLRTAVRLLWPGTLTQLYLAGKRVSYVSPVRIYIVASLLFFLFVGSPDPDASQFNVWIDDVLIGRDESDPDLVNFRLTFNDNTKAAHGVGAHAGWLGALVSADFEAKRKQLRAMPAQALLDSFFSGLERTVPTTLIFFVPILAMALKLLYLKQPFFYVDHLVFALHFQSVIFLALLLAGLANILGLSGLFSGILTYVVVILLVTPLYLLLALKRVYSQTWPWTAVKTVVLGLLYLLLIQPILVVTMLLVIRAM
jgi:hypothetical protein